MSMDQLIELLPEGHAIACWYEAGEPPRWRAAVLNIYAASNHAMVDSALIGRSATPELAAHEAVKYWIKMRDE